MSENLLPDGLRHVLVYVVLGGVFPPAQDSARDIALLRAANRAMCGKQRGHPDSFLFVFAGQAWQPFRDVEVELKLIILPLCPLVQNRLTDGAG